MNDNFTLTLNVDNVFDEYPPQTADGFFSQANTDPQVYRVLGDGKTGAPEGYHDDRVMSWAVGLGWLLLCGPRRMAASASDPFDGGGRW